MRMKENNAILMDELRHKKRQVCMYAYMCPIYHLMHTYIHICIQVYELSVLLEAIEPIPGLGANKFLEILKVGRQVGRQSWMNRPRQVDRWIVVYEQTKVDRQGVVDEQTQVDRMSPTYNTYIHTYIPTYRIRGVRIQWITAIKRLCNWPRKFEV